MAGLRIIGVSKSFGTLNVLDQVSLELADGELLVILGPSGCGKSTLLRLIAGLEELDSGEIWIGDKRVDQLRPRDRDIALVFQNYSLYPHMTVEKNLGFPLSVAKVKRSEIKERVRKTATMLGLADRLQHRPGQLSGGQRQRVALGRAIIREPAIFLLDEPLSNLDADLRARMRHEIVSLQKQLRKAMVHVTHDQIEALTMADRIALLDRGHLVQFGTPRELYETPANTFVATFLGQPKMNLVELTVQNQRTTPFALDPDGVTTEHVTLGIRPEDLIVGESGFYDGIIESFEYLGDKYIARIRHHDLILVSANVTVPPKEGAAIRFFFTRENLHWFDPVTQNRLEVTIPPLEPYRGR